MATIDFDKAITANVRVTISIAPSRPKPAVGDRRMLYGVEHVRVFRRCSFTGAYVVSGGRDCFDWVPLSEAPDYLRNKPGRWVGKARPTTQEVQ